MKKTLKYYYVVWGIVLALFNLIVFVSKGWGGAEKYTATFWIDYGFITVSFLGQLVCTCFALGEENMQKTFYNVSLVTTSYSGLLLSFVFGGLCMLISPLPYWIGLILCAVVFAFNVITVAQASAGVEMVSAIDKKIRNNTIFIKLLTADAESLLLSAKSDAVKTQCSKVYEAVRFSDPMSCEAVYTIENDLTLHFAKLQSAVEQDDVDAVTTEAEDFLLLLADRNRKCRILK